jgi:hypothetical protein
MIEDLLEATKQALGPLWQLAPPVPEDFYRHPEFLAFKSFCEQAFPAADGGVGFSFGLSDSLRGAGLPCAMKGDATPSTVDEAARAIVLAFGATTVRKRYLCPLDLADCLPAMEFGKATVCRYTPAELAKLFDGARLARYYPGQPLDIHRLAQFHWLVVEEVAPLTARAGERALPWLYEGLNRDFGAIEPHGGNHPPAVAKALFGLLLAPWEDWISLETDWRGFNVPWIHLATDDLFVRPQPVPSADTLTWVDASAQIGEDEFIEFQRPLGISLDGDAEVLLAGFDHSWWDRIETATATPLFETPVQHFLVRAAFSEGMDQIMAHMITIEAALGLQTDFGKGGAAATIKKRLAALLQDPRARDEYATLATTRNQYVHGRAIQGAVSSKDRDLARRLARRVTVALVDGANGPAGQGPRADFLNSLP